MNTAVSEACTFECFAVEVSNQVAHVKLNRPDKLNTLTPKFWQELASVLELLERSNSVRAVVLSSTGKHFSAGMDLSVFQGDVLPGTNSAINREQLRGLVVALQNLVTRIEKLRVPVLAAVHGGCIGGAFDIVTACDMRYATSDSFFCIQETNLAMMADLGTLQRLPRLIPEGVARELAYTGDKLTAERAKNLGLVNEIFDTHEQLLEHVLKIAHRIAKQSPLAVAGSKEAISYSREHTTEQSLAHAALWQSSMFDPSQIMEAGRAQATKSEPTFPDLLQPKTTL